MCNQDKYHSLSSGIQAGTRPKQTHERQAVLRKFLKEWRGLAQRPELGCTRNEEMRWSESLDGYRR